MSDTPIKENMVIAKEKLWNKNFFLLWQGQLISALGDVVYEIALGFWILAVTGSTALMGTLMAVSTLPRVILSPFAGVFVDRWDRKKVIVVGDLIRGVCITFIGVAACLGFIKIWMVFVAGIIMNLCAAFFNPAVSSTLPDITPKSKLVKANSVYNMIYTGTNIVGNSAGGFIFKILGAPIMFLINGISYLFSAFTEIFIKIPEMHRETNKEKSTFFNDMKDGFRFVWKFKGLRNFLIMAAAMNFFGGIGIMLLIPFFNMNASLGPAKYGIASGVMSLGMFLGMLCVSVINIPQKKKFMIFTGSFVLSIIFWMIFPLISIFPIMAIILGIGGFLNAIFNVLFSSTVQLTVPQEYRGKVFSLIATISGGLTPIAFAVGGILAEFIPIKILISSCFLIALLIFLPVGFTQSSRRFIEFNPDNETLDDILNV
ncbi:MFS transporter [Haloimpatiens massiliensis]|uniref:MFS transporter n=1 Tax=Haloimpatiens massiliensis TaxID=1658110 RepID=UPI000C84213B|nr:MFS transporter [Haloimpatiens massiliensis]